MSPLSVLDTIVFSVALLCAFGLGAILSWLLGSRDLAENGWWRGYEERARKAGQRHVIINEDTQQLPTVDLRGHQGPTYVPRHAAWNRPRLAITMS